MSLYILKISIYFLIHILNLTYRLKSVSLIILTFEEETETKKLRNGEVRGS